MGETQCSDGDNPPPSPPSQTLPHDRGFRAKGGGIRLDLGRQREAQEPVREGNQRLGGAADGADDLGMAGVEAAGQRAERGQDELSLRGDEAAP